MLPQQRPMLRSCKRYSSCLSNTGSGGLCGYRMIVEDQYGRLWTAGHGDNFDTREITRDNADIQNYFLDPSPLQLNQHNLWNSLGWTSWRYGS